MNYNFPHLHLHTEYSLLDSTIKLSELFEFAEQKNIKVLSITDHGNIDAAVKFSIKCKEKAIKAIIGCELYVCNSYEKIQNKEEDRKHLTVWVKNERGFKNLTYLLSKANLDYFYYRPLIPIDLLYKHVEGLIIGTGCSSSFLGYENGDVICENLKDLLKDDFYAEVMPFCEFKDHFSKVVNLAKRLGVSLIATNDVHYLYPSDCQLHEVVVNIRSKKTIKDEDRRIFDVKDLYYKSEEEMMQSFLKQNILDVSQIAEAMGNVYEAAEKCDFVLEPIKPKLPLMPELRGKDENKVFEQLCWQSMKKRKLSGSKYEERLKYEIEQIKKQGFVRYFLIVWELVDWAKNKAKILMSPGRGSVGGSLVAYVLGITEVDPVKYNLIFERFISPGRIDYPDIDMDFEDERRDEVKQHLEELYGKGNVALVSTFGKMKARQALRDVSRYYDVPLKDVNECSKSIVVRSGGDARSDYSLQDSTNTFEAAKKFKQKYPQVIEHGSRLEGILRHKGLHAAGVILSSEDLLSSGRAVLVKTPDGEIAVNWDKHDLEYMGFVKYDILGLSTLSVLSEVSKKASINFYDLDLNDKKVFELMSKGETAATFQTGSRGMQKIIRELGINSFEDIVAVNALHRPGALRTTTIISNYIERKHGRQPVKKIHPIYDKITKDTYGLVLYQEQIMYLANRLAGLPWKTADTIRKVISKSQGVILFEQYGKLFVEGCVKNKTLSAEEAAKLWKLLRNYGSYGFNRSHATSYSMLSYYTAWCKIYYPEIYFCALLNHCSESKIADYVEECRRNHIEVCDPDINCSDVDWSVNDHKIICGLKSIKGIGKEAEKIVQIRKQFGSFKSFDDFLQKYSNGNKRIIESLVKAGAFDSLENRSRLLDKVVNDKNQKAQLEIFDNKEEVEPGEYSEQQLLELQKEVLPFSLSDRFMNNRSLIEFLRQHLPIRNIGDVNFSIPSEKFEYYCGKITEVKFDFRERVARDGAIEAANTIDIFGSVCGNLLDDTSFVMLVFLPKIYRKKKAMIENLQSKDILVIARHNLKKTYLFANNVWRLDDIAKGKFGEDFPPLTAIKLVDADLSGICKKTRECRNCGFDKKINPVPIEKGKLNLMLVGEAPGYNENAQGKPFVGKAGKLLFKYLESVGLKREDFYISNVCKCFPGGKLGIKQVKSCSKFLKEEIKQIKPIVILSMGNIARYFFTGNIKGIVDANAQIRWHNEYGCFVLYSIHPSMLLHQQGNEELLKRTVIALRDLVYKLLG